MKYWIYLLMIIVTFGCASNKPKRGNEGYLLSGETKEHFQVAGLYNKELSQERYHVIEIYFSNGAIDWQRVKDIQITSVNPKTHFQIIDKSDIKAWKKSTLLDYEVKLEEAIKMKTPPPALKMKEDLKRLSEDQYLNAPLSVPAGMHTFAWVLIRTPDTPELQTLNLKVSFLDSSEATYQLSIPGKSI